MITKRLLALIGRENAIYKFFLAPAEPDASVQRPARNLDMTFIGLQKHEWATNELHKFFTKLEQKSYFGKTKIPTWCSKTATFDCFFVGTNLLIRPTSWLQ
jgi:hypothetical protein